MQLFLGHVLSLILFSTPCLAGFVNRTIDDEHGDEVTGVKPTYLPDDNTWRQGSSCSSCSITPIVDREQVLDRTWHDATYHHLESSGLIIEATFNGTAVYVFNLIAPDVPQRPKVTLTSLAFYIDEHYAGGFIHTPEPAAPDILYNVPVYANSSLSSDHEHTIQIVASGSQDSLVLFDYIIYTTEDNDPLPPSQSSPLPQSSPSPQSSIDASVGQSKSAIFTGSIIGAVVGAIAALLILSIAFYLLHRRGRLVLPMFRDKSRSLQSSQRPRFSGGLATWEVTSRSSLLSSIPTPRSTSLVVSSLGQGDTDPPHTRRSAPREAPTPVGCATTPLFTPPAHRADVPIPALSTTGTEHSLHLAGLMEEIRELEESLRDIQGEKTPPRAGRVVSVTDLRNRIVRLRTQLEKERRLMAEAFPHERERKKGIAATNAEPVAGAAPGTPSDGVAGLEDEMRRHRKRRKEGKPRKLRVVS